MVSICGSTLFIDELVHSTTTSGFADLDRLARVVRDLDAQRASEAGDLAEIAADLGRIDVDGADDLESLARRDLPDDPGADRPEPEMQDLDRLCC